MLDERESAPAQQIQEAVRIGVQLVEEEQHVCHSIPGDWQQMARGAEVRIVMVTWWVSGEKAAAELVLAAVGFARLVKGRGILAPAAGVSLMLTGRDSDSRVMV